MAKSNQCSQSILFHSQNKHKIALVIAIVRDPMDVNVERLLGAMVPEMARGKVPSSLVVCGDSILVLRNTGGSIDVQETDTTRLLALADIDTPWDRSNITTLMTRWCQTLKEEWRDRLVDEYRDLLVPQVVAGLAHHLSIQPGIWGLNSAKQN